MSFDYYFAGCQTPRLEQVIISLGANVLKSYLTEKSSLARWFQHKRDGWTGKLLIDNGEFTMHRRGGTVDIDEYIAYLNKNDEYIDYAVALDKIPGVWGRKKTREEIDYASDMTYKNYMYMREHCKSPHKLLPVYHQLERITALERILDIEGLEYMCISGRKDSTGADRQQFYTKCFDVIARSKNPNIKVHCLGSGTLFDMEMFPFASSDSTSSNLVAANGNIFVGGDTVYVGKGSKTLHADECDIISQICDNCSTTLDNLTVYQDRAVINYHYMYDMSRKTSYKKRDMLVRRLF